jgi:Protein of unknown function (DUF4238)
VNVHILFCAIFIAYMAKPNKKQHYVPKTYLAGWVDPETPQGQNPYVWVFPREGGEGKRKGPENIFTETDFYTLTGPSGERLLTLEQGLSQLEGSFARVRKKLNKGENLGSHDVTVLIAFTAAMFVRTPDFLEFQREQFRPLLEKGRAMEDWAKQASPEQLKTWLTYPPSSSQGPFATLEDIKAIVEQPVQELLIPYLTECFRAFQSMNVGIFETSDKVGFITSDAPVKIYDPERQLGSLFGPSLYSKTIFVEMPISPKFLLALNRGGNKPFLHVGTGKNELDDANRNTRIASSKTFIVRANSIDPYWFQDIPRNY